MEYPKICDLILILMAISPETNSLEKSFAKLSKMHGKDRCGTSSGMLGKLYMLSILSMKEYEEPWKKTREFLQKI